MSSPRASGGLARQELGIRSIIATYKTVFNTRIVAECAMISFLPHQGGFEKKMSPDNHLDSFDREHREHRTNTNVVKTDTYIEHFSNIFREGMMKRGEVDKLGVVTFEFDEDKCCIVYRILGPIYWPGNPMWLPRVHPRMERNAGSGDR